MNYIQILNKIETYAHTIPYVQGTNLGDIYEFLNGKPNLRYSIVNIDINQATRNDNLIGYSVYLYYVDRLTKSKSNWKEIKTTAEQVLISIINYAAENLGDIDDGYVINYFEQQFADYCAGAWVNFNLEVPVELGHCMIDGYEDIDPKDVIIAELNEQVKALSFELEAGKALISETIVLCGGNPTSTFEEMAEEIIRLFKLESTKIHNFDSGLVDEYFNISGSLSSSAGTVTYDDVTIRQCLKMNSSANVSFTTTEPTRLTLVFNQSSGSAVSIDGNSYTINENTQHVATFTLNPGSHTIKKSNKEAKLFYIKVELV